MLSAKIVAKYRRGGVISSENSPCCIHLSKWDRLQMSVVGIFERGNCAPTLLDRAGAARISLIRNPKLWSASIDRTVDGGDEGCIQKRAVIISNRGFGPAGASRETIACASHQSQSHESLRVSRARKNLFPQCAIVQEDWVSRAARNCLQQRQSGSIEYACESGMWDALHVGGMVKIG